MRQRIMFASGVFALIAGVFGVLAYRYTTSTTELSPYVNQLASPVRGLSTTEVEDLLNGRGAGFARMAELNNFPGPRHVLDLHEQLQLSPTQSQQLEAAFRAMDSEAKQVGHAIVQHERDLSATFANGTITTDTLQHKTDALATLYGRLRAVHLQAHLAITPLLSEEQITLYNTLRGYTEHEGWQEQQHTPKH